MIPNKYLNFMFFFLINFFFVFDLFNFKLQFVTLISPAFHIFLLYYLIIFKVDWGLLFLVCRIEKHMLKHRFSFKIKRNEKLWCPKTLCEHSPFIFLLFLSMCSTNWKINWGLFLPRSKMEKKHALAHRFSLLHMGEQNGSWLQIVGVP